MSDEPTKHPDEARETPWQTSETQQAALSPHRVREHDSDATDDAADDEAAEARLIPSASAAADQPHAIKAQERQNFAESRLAERTQKPKNPTKLTKASWGYSLKRAVSEFGKDQCTDLAAALTYYAVLAVFPALIGLVSILSLVGEAQNVQDFFLDTLEELLDPEMVDGARTVLEEVTTAGGAGIALVIGILTSIWTASNYVNAFSRAMNRIFEVQEGRSALKLRPVLYLTTIAIIVLIAATGLLLVTSGPIAEAVGETVGLGDTVLTVWNLAVYPMMLLTAVVVVALLYYATPNVRQPGVSWISVGALVAIVVALLATAGLGVYFSNFASYNATYGALAGVIMALFWLYVMNAVLLFGAELDSELERSRQLQAGLPAERTILLPTRDDSGSEKKTTKYEELVRQGEALRLSGGESSDPDDLWRR
ncbi:YihY/virulence factor BrkB family protein [Nesterenkonia aerolata]|uniref:YihY/virulence factor BrkB family protein n=1 Tax=Nesterenkonia aerolata TaxID=3074079 RepID=A0ABU2DNY0_9MICC|nr:YihY/virulence factor BrkB family protein [Nesterenkonia sp. LY-0111]MDR8018075.1 YihY/virulence factor BrkB family protein [Nesterenkonia sp. LY-0111]